MTHYFYTPRSGARTSSQKHHPEKENGQERCPKCVIGTHKPSGGNNAEYLKKPVANGTFKRPPDHWVRNTRCSNICLEINQKGRNNGQSYNKNRIQLEFFITQNPLEISFEGKITEHKITSRQEHKYYNDILHHWVIVPKGHAG